MIASKQRRRSLRSQSTHLPTEWTGPPTRRRTACMKSIHVLVVSQLCLFSFQALGEDLPRAEPENVGLSAVTMAGLKPALQALVDEGKIPGGIAMTVRHGKVADVTTFGYRDVQAQLPMTEDAIFAIV